MAEKKTQMIGFKTTPEIRKFLEDKAEQEERSISWIIHKMVEQEIEKEKGTAAAVPGE